MSTDLKTPVLLNYEGLKYLLLREYSRIRQNAWTPQFLRLEIPINKIDSISWLAQQKHQVKMYWADRESSFKAAAVGVLEARTAQNFEETLDRLTEMRLVLEQHAFYPQLRYWGGIPFERAPSLATAPHLGIKRAAAVDTSDWGNMYFFIPQFELLQNQPHQMRLCVNLLYQDDVQGMCQTLWHKMESLKFSEKNLNFLKPTLISRQDFPVFLEWKRSVEKILSDIAAQKVHKIVLARQTLLAFQEPVSGLEVLNQLQSVTSPGCFHFYFQRRQGQGFFGASPERFYKRDHRLILTEALAGTQLRTADPQRDMDLLTAFQSSQKDRHEHNIVVKMIQEALAKVCRTAHQSDDVSVLQLNSGYHFLSSFEGVLRDAVADKDIIAFLHPTPAVGGFPVPAALERISALENFPRGWYAAPVGYVSLDHSEFAVAIRSGYAWDKNLVLLAGAGIVAESDPQAEWNEVEGKMKNFLHLLKA